MVCLTFLQCIFKEFSKRMCSIRFINMRPFISVCSNQNAFQFFILMALRPKAGHGHLILEVSRTPLDE